jgi:thiol-disulfide isomerase/thioredoxin
VKYGVLLVLLFLVSCSQPDFVDTNGAGYRYADFKGQWLVINYWATWCAPCITEIPELITLDREHEDIHVFGVNFDQPEGEEIQAQIDRMKITFPVYADDPYRHFGIDRPEVLPTTLIVGPEGNLLATLIGPQTEESLLSTMER